MMPRLRESPTPAKKPLNRWTLLPRSDISGEYHHQPLASGPSLVLKLFSMSLTALIARPISVRRATISDSSSLGGSKYTGAMIPFAIASEMLAK